MRRTSRSIPRWFTQASSFAWAGVVAAGCSGKVDAGATSIDQGTPDAAADAPMAMYGPAQVDSGSQDAVDEGHNIYYGPAQVDSGALDAAIDEPMIMYGPVQVDAAQEGSE